MFDANEAGAEETAGLVRAKGRRAAVAIGSVVERAEVDYLTLEYLAELTMSILARLREKDPAAGYAGDFIASENDDEGLCL